MTIAQQAEQGLTLQKIISDIPHDAGAIIVYVVLALFIGFVWYGNRKQVKAGR